MMTFVLKLMNLAFKTRNCAFKTRNVALMMMVFAGGVGPRPGGLLRREPGGIWPDWCVFILNLMLLVLTNGDFSAFLS